MIAVAEALTAEPVTEQSLEDRLDDALAAGQLFQPGVVYTADQISNELYHRGPGISSTNIKHAKVSALHWKIHKEHPKPPTPAMMLGTLLHTLVLEPDVFEQQYCKPPENAPRRPTDRSRYANKPSPATVAAVAFWDEWDAEHVGMTIIDDKPGDDLYWKPSDWDNLHAMRDALVAHPFAGAFLGTFEAEKSMYWNEEIIAPLPSGDQITSTVLCKCRFDIHDLAHALVIDLKTAADASCDRFKRAVFDFGYHISEQHYLRGAKACGIKADDFVFIVIEKEPPYAIGCYTLDEQTQHLGGVLRREGLEVIATAETLKEYPCYPPHVRVLEIPQYANRRPIK